MADIKRVNYFTHQFLVEKDFDDEQDYHIDMRRRHNRVNHSWGVAEGLDVTKTENKKVTISPGTSIDKDGQEIVLLEPLPVDLTAFGSNSYVYLSISYQEVFDEADHYTSGGVDDYTRTTERPKIESSEDAPDPLPGNGSLITLARVHLDGSGNVDAGIDNTMRKSAGSKIAPGAVSTNELANNAITNTKIANDAVTAAKIAYDTITETRLNKATRAKLVTNGNSHDHSGGDGAQIRHSTLGMNDGRNPHGTRAADIDKQDGSNRIVAQINAGTGVIAKKNIDPAAGSSGWVRLPFLPKKSGEKTEFIHKTAFSSSGPEGAAGNIEIPVPLGATRMKNFRIAGKTNAKIIRVMVYIIELFSYKERFSFSIEGAPFDELFIIDRTINAETGYIVVEVEAFEASAIWLVASQFE